MTRVSGFLQTVIKEPSKVTGVWVRADRLRVSTTGLTTPEQESVEWNPDTGEIGFDAEPGPATLVLQYLGRAESVLIGVPDEPTATLRQVVGHDYEYPVPVLTEVERYRNEAVAAADRVGSAERVLQAEQSAVSAAASTAADRAQVAADRDHVTAVADQMNDAYMRGAEYPLPGALGVLKARLMTKEVAPIVLVFAGSSTTSGSNVPLAARWVTRIADRASHEPVISSYEAAVAAAPFLEGVTVVNMGRSGFNASTYIRSEEAPVIGSWAPTLVVHAAGANDARTSWGYPATVSGSISARIDAIDAASPLPVAHIVMHQHERYDGPLLAPWRDYWEALAGIATTRPNVTVLNAADVFKALGIPGSDPLALMASDKIHVNTKGHAIYSDLIGDVLDLPEKAPKTTVLFDDFNRADNEDIAGDSPTIGPSGTVWESLTAPKLRIRNGRLAAQWETNVTGLVDTGVADGDITVDFDFLTPSTSLAGVVFRATDINNRWGVYIGGVSNNVQLYRMIGGTNTILVGATVAGAKYSKAGLATMRIRVKGQRISAWIDGVKVIEHTMTEAENAASRSWTKVGFRITSQVAEFDNLKVTSV